MLRTIKKIGFNQFSPSVTYSVLPVNFVAILHKLSTHADRQPNAIC